MGKAARRRQTPGPRHQTRRGDHRTRARRRHARPARNAHRPPPPTSPPRRIKTGQLRAAHVVVFLRASAAPREKRCDTSRMHALAFAISFLLAQMEQHEHDHHEERLGTVTFQTSCSPAAQAKFTRAVALLHSFWYEEAEKAFTDVANVDPQCGMAWWGMAMSNYHPVWPS